MPIRSLLSMLLLACGALQAAPAQGCDQAVVRYAAPSLVPLAGRLSVTRLAALPRPLPAEAEAEVSALSPQTTAAFLRLPRRARGKDGASGETIEVFTTQGAPKAWRIDVLEPASKTELQWLNEELLFIRAWWGRIVSTDLIFHLGTGRFLYAQEANYGRLTQPCEGPGTAAP